MNWNQIQYVITTAEEKNMTHAAKKLFISQPSLSISIHQLEKELGSTLFERKNGNLELTYTGTLFYEWAKSVSLSQTKLYDLFAEISNGTREKIRIGISPHRSSSVTPQLLQTIYQRYPHCEIVLSEKPANELSILLDNQELDMIVDIPRENQVIYHNERITTEGMCLAVPISYVGTAPFLETEKRIPLHALEPFPFIMLPEESKFGKTSRDCIQLSGFVPRIICTCTFSETVKNLVAEQIGIALLPDFFTSDFYRSSKIQYYKVTPDTFQREIAVVYRNDRYHSRIFLDIVQIIRQTFLEIYHRTAT